MPKVRTIDVQPGDAFDAGCRDAFVVERVDAHKPWKAYGRYIDTGRATSIQIARLQAKYKRLGMVDTAAAHRKLSKIDKAK